MNKFAIVAGVFAVVATGIASAGSTVPPGLGMYALSGTVLDQGTTCTLDQRLPLFSYLLFLGPKSTASRFYFLSVPGTVAEAVWLPKARGKAARWRGDMTWPVSPFTMQPPAITTSFDLRFTYIDNKMFFLNGLQAIPTADGGTCVEAVNYTLVRTGD